MYTLLFLICNSTTCLSVVNEEPLKNLVDCNSLAEYTLYTNPPPEGLTIMYKCVAWGEGV